MRWTEEELAEYQRRKKKKPEVEPKPSKFRNKKTEIDGITFDSKKEAGRYMQLKMAERAGAIQNLQLQPKFPLVVEGVKVCTYIADFAYDENGQRVIEDVKSEFTRKQPVYRLKKKLMNALGHEIKEV